MTAYDDKTIEQFRLGKFTREKSTSTEAETLYFSLRPGYHTMVTLNKDGSTATLKTTNDYDGGNVDDAVFGDSLSTGTDAFQKGFTPGLTGLELDVTAYVGDVVFIVTQFLLGD